MQHRSRIDLLRFCCPARARARKVPACVLVSRIGRSVHLPQTPGTFSMSQSQSVPKNRLRIFPPLTFQKPKTPTTSVQNLNPKNQYHVRPGREHRPTNLPHPLQDGVRILRKYLLLSCCLRIDRRPGRRIGCQTGPFFLPRPCHNSTYEPWKFRSLPWSSLCVYRSMLSLPSRTPAANTLREVLELQFPNSIGRIQSHTRRSERGSSLSTYAVSDPIVRTHGSCVLSSRGGWGDEASRGPWAHVLPCSGFVDAIFQAHSDVGRGVGCSFSSFSLLFRHKCPRVRRNSH